MQSDIIAKEASVKSLNKAGESLKSDCSYDEAFVETQRLIHVIDDRLVYFGIVCVCYQAICNMDNINRLAHFKATLAQQPILTL